MDVTWIGFLRRKALVGDRRAQLIMRYAKPRPSNTKRAIRVKHKDGTLDSGTYGCLIRCVDELAAAFRTVRPCIVVCDRRDWLDLGNGGMMRRTYRVGGT